MADEIASKERAQTPAALRGKQTGREDRLSAALRANLRRRKAAPPGPPAPGPPAPGPPASGPMADRPSGKGA